MFNFDDLVAVVKVVFVLGWIGTVFFVAFVKIATHVVAPVCYLATAVVVGVRYKLIVGGDENVIDFVASPVAAFFLFPELVAIGFDGFGAFKRLACRQFARYGSLGFKPRGNSAFGAPLIWSRLAVWRACRCAVLVIQEVIFFWGIAIRSPIATLGGVENFVPNIIVGVIRLCAPAPTTCV